MVKKFYITTPIYYPNDVPHLGHAYTTIIADVLSRYYRQKGVEVFFTTGTDDHGKKILTAAQEQGKKPKEFVDALIPFFKENWKKLNISYDRFIRTTDKDHEKIVQEIMQKIYDKGDIYLGDYEGYYCVGCEAYMTEKDLVDGCCPIHKKKVELMKEKSYFFKLSKYQDKLLKLYEKDFIFPSEKKKEIVNRVKEGLRDFSVSRASFDWGVKLPFDKKHVAYVWFDALLNYYSSTREKGKEDFWPANVHIIGKDIFWFHAVYWPAMLMSAGIKLPKKLAVHGFWTSEGHKMSKSLGNSVSIDKLVSIAGVDSARYFLLRSTSFGQDGDFSEKELIDRHNGELANKLGNLVSRVAGLIEKYGVKKGKGDLIKTLDKKAIESLIEGLEFDKTLNEIFAFVDRCNEYVQNKKPWETKDSVVLGELKDSILVVADLLWPFIPESAEKIKEQFSAKEIKKGDALFKRIE